MSTSSVQDLTAPMHLGLKAGPLCPMSNQGSPEALRDGGVPRIKSANKEYWIISVSNAGMNMTIFAPAEIQSSSGT